MRPINQAPISQVPVNRSFIFENLTNGTVMETTDSKYFLYHIVYEKGYHLPTEIQLAILSGDTFSFIDEESANQMIIRSEKKILQ